MSQYPDSSQDSIENQNLALVKLCRWCKSEIPESASLCKECGQWQSRTLQLISPSTALALFGALAAWLAVGVQIMPSPPNPVLVAAQAVDSFERKVVIGCENDKTNKCVGEFWWLHSKANDSINLVPNLEAREKLRNKTDVLFNEHSYKYVELYEFVTPQDF